MRRVSRRGGFPLPCAVVVSTDQNKCTRWLCTRGGQVVVVEMHMPSHMSNTADGMGAEREDITWGATSYRLSLGTHRCVVHVWGHVDKANSPPQEGCSEQMLFWATHAHHLREGLGGGEATHLVPPHTLLDLGGQRNIAQNFLIAIFLFVCLFLVRSPPEPQCCGKKQSE